MKRPLLIMSIAAALAAMSEIAFAADPRPPFNPLRYEEDYRFLRDPALRTDAWDAVKYIPLADGDAGYLSFGGELRERFESYENEFFRRDPNADNAYLLQRYLLHVDYHASERFRIFGQLQSSLEDGRPGGPRPTDRDEVDVHQLFFDVVLLRDNERSLTLRAGRQELSYGSERLVSAREGTNNRRAFDAARLIYQHGGTSVDVFVSSPVEVDPGVFDDQSVHDLWFWGASATVPLDRLPGMKLDLYYLGLHNPLTGFSQGRAREERHTVGTRFFGTRGNWDFNHEAMYQFGEFGDGDIRAWSVATDHGYTLPNVWGKPRFGLKAAIATGDQDAGDADLETLNPLFPRGNYFTEASLLGPQNFIDLRPCVRLNPAKDWIVDLGCDLYWRESRDDGIYTPGGTVIFRGNPAFSRFVGTDLSLIVSWQVSRHLQVSGSYTHFFAGRFIEQNGGEDANYGALWVTYKF